MRRALLMISLVLVALAPPARATNYDVTIRSFAFSPEAITIAVGDTVTWTNRDPSAHSATADDGSFNTGNLGNGGSRAMTFSNAGTFPYHCQLHPTMKGTVVVQAPTPVVQQPPVARFTLAVKDLVASADSSASTDPDGEIVNRTWEWGDGSTSFGVTATHTYGDGGDYRVTLRIRDDQRLTSEATDTARARVPAPPVASLRVTSEGLVATADASGTTSNLTLITTRWRFGDGATLACDQDLHCSASGPSVSTLVPGKRAARHVYLRGGDFDASLLVRDARDRDAEANGTAHIDDPRPLDLHPNVTGSTLSLDASSLPRYGNATFAWSFEDGANATGEKVAHAFPRAGTWTFTLELRDEAGTQRLHQQATVGPFPPTPSTPATAATKPTPAPGAWLAVLALAVATATRRKLAPESPK